MAKTLLIVDDDDTSRMLLSDFLEDYDFDIYEADSIENARNLINETIFNVAVLDMHLPDGTGVEIAKLLNTSSPDARILLLSGDETETTREACEVADATVHGHLTKPFSLQGIIEWIER